MVKLSKLMMVIGFLMTASPALAESAHDFSFQSIEGGPLPLSQFAGKAVLLVNTASLCGFTPQYKGLQALYDAYKDKGLVVLGVPSNDFGGQEPGEAEEIKAFCANNYFVTFPMTEKQVVKGEGVHPFYKWAAQELGDLAEPRWNFHKYLVDKQGNLVDWFSTPTDPMSDKVTTAVEKALAN